MFKLFVRPLITSPASNAAHFLSVRGSRPGKSVQMTEAEVRGL